MKNQIRAPKARKVNSYLAKSTMTTSINSFENKEVADFLILEKRNSENNLHFNALREQDNEICLESNESEFNEQLNKLSVISEIKQIHNQSTTKELRASIERCENPFSKNFELENENPKENKKPVFNLLDEEIDLIFEKKLTYNGPSEWIELENSTAENSPNKDNHRRNSKVLLFNVSKRSNERKNENNYTEEKNIFLNKETVYNVDENVYKGLNSSSLSNTPTIDKDILEPKKENMEFPSVFPNISLVEISEKLHQSLFQKKVRKVKSRNKLKVATELRRTPARFSQQKIFIGKENLNSTILTYHYSQSFTESKLRAFPKIQTTTHNLLLAH